MQKYIWMLWIGLAMEGSLLSAQETAERSLRLNQIQVVGTHNSYHLRPPTCHA
jgi:hypothetical protein